MLRKQCMLGRKCYPILLLPSPIGLGGVFRAILLFLLQELSSVYLSAANFNIQVNILKTHQQQQNC